MNIAKAAGLVLALLLASGCAEPQLNDGQAPRLQKSFALAQRQKMPDLQPERPSPSSITSRTGASTTRKSPSSCASPRAWSRGYPCTFVVDRQGRIAAAWIGQISRTELTALVEPLL